MATSTADLVRRHSGLVDCKRLENLTVDIIGCGGIGSWTALALAKMGVGKLRLFDSDKVAIENIGTQLFGPDMLDMPKAEATQRLIRDLAGVEVEATHGEVTEEHDSDGAEVAIFAVDSIKVRKVLWRVYAADAELIIDPRMGGENTSMWLVTQDNRKLYLKDGLFDDEPEEIDCTSKAIMFTTQGTAALVANGLTRWINGDKLPANIFVGYNDWNYAVTDAPTKEGK